MHRSLPLSNSRGVVLLIVLFVILFISGIGLIAVYAMQSDFSTAQAYRLRRQADMASKQAAVITLKVTAQQGDIILEGMRKNALKKLLELEKNTPNGSNNFAMSRKYGMYQVPSESFSALTVFNKPNDQIGKFLADLSKPVILGGVMSDPTPLGSVEGFSNELCRYRIRINALSRIGTPIREDGNGYSQYDLDHSLFSEDAQLMYVIVKPVSCN